MKSASILRAGPARRRSRRGWWLAGCLAGGLALAGCGDADPAEPVARVDVARSEVVLPHGAGATLETVWEPTAPLGLAAPEPWVFVHLLGSDGEVLRTFDHPYSAGWSPGQAAEHGVDLWQSVLAPPLPPGRYDLTLGLIDGPTGTRWPLDVEGRRVDEGEYVVAQVVVPERRAEGEPEVGFTRSWRPVVPGSDHQTLAVRWLETEGSIVLRDVEGPLDLDLTLLVPDPDDGSWSVHRVAGAGGGPETLSVALRPGCGAEPLRLNGAGVHEVRLELRPDEGAATCEVRIEPDYVLVDVRSFQRLSVELRRVSWSRPGSPRSGDGAP